MDATAPPLQLRDYQVDAVKRMRDLVGQLARREDLRCQPRVLLQSETASGKTVMALEPMRRCYELGRRCIFIARGRELVRQASEHLWGWGIPHGVIMRDEDVFTQARVQVCSKDTLVSWCLRRQRLELPEADLVIVDEAHESLSRLWRKLIDSYPNSVVIGLTATPCRTDGRGMGDLYHGLVQAIPPSQLIAQGWVVPCRVFAPYRPDLKGVPSARGDYVKKALGKVMDKARLVGDIVQHWKELGQDRQTIVYATGVSHSLHLRDEFLRAGIVAEHLDGRTPTPERDAILARLEDGTTRVVCNVGVLVQGVDIPSVGCGVLACPTKSYLKFRQSIGRLKRPFPGKEYALVLDHAGAVYLHGMPDDDVDWQLETSEKIQDRLAQQRQRQPEREPKICPKCHCAFSRQSSCPNCGYELQRQPIPKPKDDGKLVEVSPTRDLFGGADVDLVQLERYWKHCLGVQCHRGLSINAAAMMYKSKTKMWPNPRFKHFCHGDQWKMRIADLWPEFLGRRVSSK